MTRIFFTALTGLLLTFPAAAQSLRIDPAVVDMGEIRLKTKNRVNITCYNITDKPLVIRDIQVDCTCTKPSWKKAPVLPGDSTQVTVTFTPTDTGAFYKTLHFVTAPDSPKKTELILRGKVL